MSSSFLNCSSSFCCCSGGGERARRRPVRGSDPPKLSIHDHRLWVFNAAINIHRSNESNEYQNYANPPAAEWSSRSHEARSISQKAARSIDDIILLQREGGGGGGRRKEERGGGGKEGGREERMEGGREERIEERREGRMKGEKEWEI